MSAHKWHMLSAIGGRILDMKDGWAKGELPLSETVKQPTGVFHAGAIVTLADEVASVAVYGQYDELSRQDKLFPYAVHLSVNLLANDPVGPLEAEAQVLQKGSVAVVDTVVTTSTGSTAALMRSVHRLVDLKKSGPHKR
jgi:uncharacterized protein (TIGR00369 family)